MKGWSCPRPGLFKLNIVINYHVSMSCVCVRLKLYVNWKECILKISNLKSTNAAKTMFTNCVMCGHVDRSVVNSRHIRTLYHFHYTLFPCTPYLKYYLVTTSSHYLLGLYAEPEEDLLQGLGLVPLHQQAGRLLGKQPPVPHDPHLPTSRR